MTSFALMLLLQAPPVFEVSTERVRVEARVTEGERPLRDLALEEFEIRDGGTVRTLEPLMREAEASLDVVLVLDRSGSVAGAKLDALRAAARALLDGLRTGDRAALIPFADEIGAAAELTDDLASVRVALDAPFRTGGTALNDAIYVALRYRRPEGRRLAVIVFSDGVDNRSILSEAEVQEAARRSDALVYAIAVRGPDDPRSRLLAEVTALTGGRDFAVDRFEDLRERFVKALEDLRERYVLTYTPLPSDATGWHPIEVRVKRKTAKVVARSGYWREASP